MSPKKRVVMAMSGGVDSSVAAYLLKKKGYDVVGIAMKLYEQTKQDRSSGCCSPEDFEDARRVAEKIGIPFYVIDLQESFKRAVIDYFISEYKKGRTPNPCVMCNEKMKFDVLIKKGLALDADYVATGHYAQIKHGEEPELFISKDKNKDQTYFLFSIQKQALNRMLFPVGHLEKGEVRKIAEEQGFVTAHKPESQEICFVTNDDYKSFLKPYIEAQVGKIKDEAGNIVGEHQGYMNYTKGQRRGLGIAHSEPLYVKEIDSKNNEVRVSQRGSLFEKGFVCEKMNWFTSHHNRILEVKTRYRQKTVPVHIVEEKEGFLHVKLQKPLFAISPGQAAVFYEGDRLIGGGWIH
ncbi:MAG: tRNA 2-thiouridine(34) synthase MnmA [Deltaproteobacteria bacterium]|nr:tRNA 2-thiouridine(34) synthase MnmA [Deltaproteobacteria bacterium]